MCDIFMWIATTSPNGRIGWLIFGRRKKYNLMQIIKLLNIDISISRESETFIAAVSLLVTMFEIEIFQDKT